MVSLSENALLLTVKVPRLKIAPPEIPAVLETNSLGLTVRVLSLRMAVSLSEVWPENVLSLIVRVLFITARGVSLPYV